MDQIKKSDDSPLELSVQTLIQGVLALEQGQAKKTLVAIQKGLERLVAHSEISSYVAREFRKTKTKILEKKEKKMKETAMKVNGCGTGVGRVRFRVRDYGWFAAPAGFHLCIFGYKDEIESLPWVRKVEATHKSTSWYATVDKEVYENLTYQRGNASIDGHQTFRYNPEIIEIV